MNKTGPVKAGRRERVGAGLALVVAAMFAIVTGGISLSSVALAQSGEMRSLVDRLNRLERDFNDVQRQFYRGEKPGPRSLTAPGTSPGTSSGTNFTENPEAYALLSERLDQLEEEQRNMTGPLEEANFKLDQMAKRLDKLVIDVDFRLTAIENRLASSPPTGDVVGSLAPQSQPPAGTAPVAPAGTLPPGKQVVVNEGQLRTGVKVLGTISAQGDNSPPEVAAVPKAPEIAVAAPAILPPGSPQEQYNFAIDFVRKGQFDIAESAFSEFLEKHKDHVLAGNAQYWLGETHYVRGDYPSAASAFLAGYQTYPENTKAADNLLKLAMSLSRMDQKEEACAALVQLDQQFTKLPSRVSRAATREKKNAGCEAN